MFEKPPKIIPALDVNLKKAKEILKEISDLKDEIAAIKVGSILCWKHGLESVISELKNICNFPIIFDAQKAGTDIPEIIEEQVKIVADSRVDAFIAAPQGSGSVTLETFVRTCVDYEIIPIIVVEMTHLGFDTFLSKDASEKILEKSIELDIENYVAPANRPERLEIYRNIARQRGKDIKILSPGVGPQGGGPDMAVRAGADFVIVGRAIYQARNPREEVIRLYNMIRGAYVDREYS